uniref:Uncharacterized protein n=1 Tax=Opuntia streptacantha TaxID=393608 RepID=A0A7C9CLG1_OPUST
MLATTHSKVDENGQRIWCDGHAKSVYEELRTTQNELQTTQAQLQSTQEELRTTSEELKATKKQLEDQRIGLLELNPRFGSFSALLGHPTTYTGTSQEST